MSEDEDLLDAIKEWEDRCKEAERQVASLMKAVDWMSQKIKVLESERDSANLQIIEERERYAKIAESWKIPALTHLGSFFDSGWNQACEEIAAQIRTRSVPLKTKHESDER